MQVKVFTSPKLHEALSEVRKSFGPDAVVLDRFRREDETGNMVWHVYAARDDAPEVGSDQIWKERLEPTVRRLERIVEGLGRKEVAGLCSSLPDEKARRVFDELVRLGVSPCTASDIAEDIASGRDAGEKMIPRNEELNPEETREIVLITGPRGAGKTTLAAKIATHFSLKGVSVAFLSTATEQIEGLTPLRTYANLLGTPFLPVRKASASDSALDYVKSARLVLVDTEGWTDVRSESLERQNGIWKRIPFTRRILVMPANLDESDGDEVIENAQKLGIETMAFTRMDETRKPGKIVNWALKGLAVSYFSDSPEATDPLGLLTPQAMTRLLKERFRFQGER